MSADPCDAALQRVQTYCGWHIAPSRDDTLTLDGLGTRTLMLPSLYVTAVDSVSVDYGDGSTALDADAYDWSQAGMIELRGWGCFPRRFRSVVVELTHGYDLMPDDVQQVIDRVTDRADSETGALVRVGQVQYATLPSGVALGSSLSEVDKADLAAYKLPPRP